MVVPRMMMVMIRRLVGFLVAHRLLLLILGVGVGLRLGWLWFQWDASFVLDEQEYVRIARDVREGGYLGEVDDPRWIRPPLFPLWLALTLGPGNHLLLARLGQVFLGGVLMVLLYRVTRSAWGDRRSALVCAALAALSLPLIVFSNYLMAEMLLLVLLCGLLLVLLALARRPQHPGRSRYGLAALAGVLLGLAMLTKPIALAAIPATLGAAVAGGQSWRRRVGYALLVLVGVAVVLAPWAVRNGLVYDRFIPLDTTGGYNLWIGNRPPGQGGAIFEETMRTTYPNPSDRSAAFAALAWNHMHRFPVSTMGQIWEKMGRFWRLQLDVLATEQYGELFVFCPGDSTFPMARDRGERFGEVLPPCWWRWSNLLADGGYLLMLVGVLVALLWLRPTTFAWIGGLWVAPIYGATVLALVQPRLRLPLLPILLPYAAAGLVHLGAMLWRRANRAKGWNFHLLLRLLRNGRVVVAVLVCLVAAWSLRLIPLVGSQVMGSAGAWAWQAGHPEQAREYYRAAVRWYPTRLSTLVAAGQVAEALGAYDEAMARYRAAQNVVYYEAHSRLGVARIFYRRSELDRVVDEVQATSLSSRQLERIAFAAALLPPQAYVDIGSHAADEYGYVLGLYPAEGQGEGASFRWTGAQAAIRFGTLPTAKSVLRVRLATSRPGDTPIPQVHVRMNGTTIASTAVKSEWRVYRLLVPPTPQGVALMVQTDTIRVSEGKADGERQEDARHLGVMLDWAALDALTSVGTE